MVIIKIAGGLGNQLFQFAFGLFVSEIFSTKVAFDIQVHRNCRNFTNRELEIAFLFDIPIANKNDVVLYKKSVIPLLARLERKIVQKMPFIEPKYVVQKDAHTLPDFFSDNVYYDGYWQNYTYLDKIKHLFINRIRLKESYIITQKTVLHNIKISNSVSIHIRQGDYLNINKNSKIFHICELDYFNHAIEIIKQKVDNPVFYIFTQDIIWAKSNFNRLNFNIIEGNSAVEDLILMSKCKHNIIANSTFSWWGAWLNQNNNKIIIAPRNWYKGKLNHKIINLIPPSWIQI